MSRGGALVLVGTFVLASCFALEVPGQGSPTVDDGGSGIRDLDAGTDAADSGVPHGLDRATCTFNGRSLAGRNVRYVTSLPDIRIRVVTSLPDFRVRTVDALPSRCGEWRVVTSLADFTVQEVDAFGDFTVEYVDSFPGFP